MKTRNSQGLCPACQIPDITTLFQLPSPSYPITHYTILPTTLFQLPDDPLHSILYTVHCTQYTSTHDTTLAQYTLYTLHMYTVYCTLYTVYFTHVHCILYNVYCILCIIV